MASWKRGARRKLFLHACKAGHTDCHAAASVRICPRRANLENAPFFRLPPEANTRWLKAQLYVWTEVGQNQYSLAESDQSGAMRAIRRCSFSGKSSCGQIQKIKRKSTGKIAYATSARSGLRCRPGLVSGMRLLLRRRRLLRRGASLVCLGRGCWCAGPLLRR
jgi:hypothetical protein